MGDFTSWELTNANKIHQVIKHFRHFFPYEFEKCDIEWCDKCGGKGFIPNSINGRSMTGLGAVCKKCNGVGYYGYKFFEDGRVCSSCNGVGCRRCDNAGRLDWIKAVMGAGK